MATIIVSFWEFTTWWGLVVPDSDHLANEVVDWVWLDRSDPDLFVPRSALVGRAAVPPDWPECHKELFSGREDGEAGLLSGAFPAALQPVRRLSWLAS